MFSDAAIQVCLTLKALFRLPLRQTTGMVASLLEIDWPVPAFSTLSRRQKALIVEIPCCPPGTSPRCSSPYGASDNTPYARYLRDDCQMPR